MSLIDRVLCEPEFKDAPPVLVDVGAAGGVHRAWRRVAPHAIGFGFEPDARETAPLTDAQRQFKQWHFYPAIAVPDSAAVAAPFHLARAPQCSSVLPPNVAALTPWVFADAFSVERVQSVPAISIGAALAARGLNRIDWLKCDTQGLDLRLFQSLPDPIRASVLAVEFEPGLIDAYEGEDTVAAALAAMAHEPYWISEFNVNQTVRGNAAQVAQAFGRRSVTWVRRLGPGAPGWANIRWLRDFTVRTERLDRRAHLLSWVFATATAQHTEALMIALRGAEHHGPALFDTLVQESRRSLRWLMARRLPATLWRRLVRA